MIPRICLTCAVRGPNSFCSLSTQSLLNLQSIGTSVSLAARYVLINEGFSADHVFLICSGRVKLLASSPDGRILLLRVAGPGDVLGLASILHGDCYRVTAETLEPCVVKSVPRNDFLRFMEDFSDAGRSATGAMAREYDSALLSARRLALSNSAAGKLASALLDWARLGLTEPVASSLPLTFHMPLTHEELGSLAGISRETVTRLLGKFRREGLLHQLDERMVLHHPGKLEALYC